MYQAGHTIRKVLSLLRQHLPENRGILAYRSELLIPLTYKTPHRDLIQTVYLSDQSLPQLTGRGCGIHVSATLRFSDDGVNHPQLPRIQQRYQGEPELLSQAHSPLSLPVPFRKHMATPAHRITVPAFLTHDHHRPTR